MIPRSRLGNGSRRESELRKHALAAVALALPVAAHAQPVSDAHLEATFDRCVERCGSAHDGAFCREICGCVVGEISRHWDMAEFRARMEQVRVNPEDPEVQAQMGRLTQHYARRIQSTQAPAATGPRLLVGGTQ